jgi:murein L,D-transpeptidase YcbB/YkuD
MIGVLVGRPVILVAVVLVALSGASAWADRGSDAALAPPAPLLATLAADGSADPSHAAPARALKRLAQSRIAVSDAATEGDEVPSPALIRKGRGVAAPRPADFMGGDEVPSVAAVNPATPDTSIATPQPAAAPSGGDEVPVPSAAPVAPAAAAPAMSPSRPAATEGGEAAPNVAVTPPAPPAPPPAPVDPIAEQMRDLASGKFDRLWGGEREKRAALDAFYSKRNYAPIWIADGKANDRAVAAIDYLAHVDADGLNPADYVVPDVAAMTDPASLAEGELKLSAAVVAYAHHAQVGRVHWTRVSGDIFYDVKASAPADVLANLAGTADVAAALAAYEPQAAGYLALKAKLAELRGGSTSALPGKIPAGPGPKVGAKDPRVPLVRQRLGVTGDPELFDNTLSEAVKKFQADSNLKASGLLDAATIDALNGRHPTPTRLVDLVLVNMERWRWMPHDLGKTYVLVNLTEYMVYVTHNGRQVWSTRIVDGKPETPTPIMSVDMKSITINPTWNIPDTIAAKEYVPMLRQDPTILERMGLTVTYNQNGTIHISQPPGPQNALGQLRFNLPNKFLVYQHDSNEKYLFSKPVRDTSHGCMRIENPVKYAEVLLSIARPREGYTEDRIRGLFGNQEREIGLPTYIPVHVTYQTAFVDKDGRLQTREDIYGRDRALLAILKSDDRKMADMPIERRENAVRREALAVPDQIWGGGNIFSRLFGGVSSQPPRPPGRVR